MRFLLYAVLVFACGVTAQLVIASQPAQEPLPAQPSASAIAPLIGGQYVVAAPGRVEPASEEIAIGVPITGLLAEVLVKEGDTVTRGQVVARIEDAEYRATLGKTEAQLHLREAELLRLNNGARPQERKQAAAAVQEAEAVAKNTGEDLERRRALLANSVVSRETFDRAQRENQVAQRRLEMAREKYALVEDKAREEDVAIATAQVDLARAARDEARAQLEKTLIRSPIDGTVLRVNRHAGELMSIFLDSPVVTVGDVSRLYVRADVDEADIARLEVGMRAYVTAEAFGEQRFTGRVIRLGRTVGKKNLRTDDPKEHADAKILEALIALDDSRTLPTGLRVNAFMLPPLTSAAAEPRFAEK